VRQPSKVQARALATAICRGNAGSIHSIVYLKAPALATVVALQRRGWAQSVIFYEDKCRGWAWFTVTEAARALSKVQTEIARMKAYDADNAHKWNEEDDVDPDLLFDQRLSDGH
jgi:hypothetical protein